MPETAFATLMSDPTPPRVRDSALSDEQYVRAALDVFLGGSSSPAQFRQQPTLDPTHALGVEERAALDAVGMLPDAQTQADAEAARAEALNVFFHIFESALSTTEAARMMGRNPSRIRQRIREGSLLALETDGEMRLPVLQFHQGVEIPGLGQVLRALPRGIDTREALSWLTTPIPDLADPASSDDRPRSPRDYLLQTGDAAAVVRIAAGLARGEAG